MDNLEGTLSEHPFFKDLNADILKLVVGCASNVRFEKGDFIFREGEEADQFYLIRHGSVGLEIFSPSRGALEIQTLDEGDILGWSWLIPPYEARFDARAKELTRAIALDGKCLRAKCEDDHNLGYELLKRFSSIVGQRLDATRVQLLDIYGVNA
jgi:CRP-like cAMP-binding protein